MAKAKLDENKQTVIQQNMKLLRKIRNAVKELSPDKSGGLWRLHGMKGLDGEAFVAYRAAREEFERTTERMNAQVSEARTRLREKYDIDTKQKAADDAYKVLRQAQQEFEEEYGILYKEAETAVDRKTVQDYFQDAEKNARKEANKLYKELIRLEVLTESGKTPEKVGEQILALAKALGLVNQDD